MEKIASSQPSPLMFFGVGLALGTSSFVAVSVQNIFPYIAGSLATSDHHAVWVLTFMVMNWAIGSTLMPWVSARMGLRGAFNLSLFSLLISSVVCATTSNIWIMLLFRGVQGIGAGIMVPLSQTIFIRYCSPERRMFHCSPKLAPLGEAIKHPTSATLLEFVSKHITATDIYHLD